VVLLEGFTHKSEMLGWWFILDFYYFSKEKEKNT